MDAILKRCLILFCGLWATSAVNVGGQRPGCGISLGNESHQQVDSGPTEGDILEMVKAGFSFNLKHMSGMKASQPPSDSFSRYLRRKRSSHRTFGKFHDDQLLCSTQPDQSQPYALESDPTGFPTELIAAELFQRSLPGSDLLFQCLARTLVEEEKGPVIEPQPLLLKGTTCPQVYDQLWNYNSVKYGNILCWALTSFQESILYTKNCQGNPCLGCSALDVPFSFDLSITYQKTCLPRFQAVSLWAFCPSLPEFKRIVWDRIVVPVDCSCSTVSCKKSHTTYHG